MYVVKIIEPSEAEEWKNNGLWQAIHSYLHPATKPTKGVYYEDIS
jgi:hypothetical protein